MKKLWDSNGYGGDFDYLFEHHRNDVIDMLKDDTILERTYNKRKISCVLPLEITTMDPRYNHWDDTSEITEKDQVLMNGKYPKKPRRDEYENLNEIYPLVNTNVEPQQCCYMAQENVGLMSRLQNSLITKREDPPEITNNYDTESNESQSNNVQSDNLIVEENTPIQKEMSEEKTFILYDEDVSVIQKSHLLVKPKKEQF